MADIRSTYVRDHGNTSAHQQPANDNVEAVRTADIQGKNVIQPLSFCSDGESRYHDQPGIARADNIDINNTHIVVHVDQDQDDDDDGNTCTACLARSQSRSRDNCENNKYIYIWMIKAVLLILYFAYFGYALHYEFGSEPSVRLLWVTCLVVFFISLNVFWHYCGKRIKECCAPCTKKLEKHEHLISWLLVICLFAALIIFTLVDVFVYTKQPYNLVSGCGILIFIFISFIFSVHPTKVQWRAVVWGLGLQFLFAVMILRWQAGYQAFEWLGARVTEFLDFSDVGAKFLLGDDFLHHYFAFKILPTVTFFGTVMSILYYMGAMQVIIHWVAVVMQFSMGTTAGESLSAAGNIFVGQTEAPLLVRSMLPDMTKSELHAVMTGGFSTVAGGILAAYIGFNVPANHLLSASVMSAPAALAVSKLFYPETEKSKTSAKDIRNLPKSDDANLLAAAANGASQTIMLVANIAVNLVAFLAILAFINTTLTWFGNRVGLREPEYQPLTFELICSYVLFPVALIMGVDVRDCRKVAQLIGVKTFLNEFIAYNQLGVLITNRELFETHLAANGTFSYNNADILLDPLPGANITRTLHDGILSVRSEVIATYSLCGFANINAIGIQLGALGAMAPNRQSDLARIGFRAMIAGCVACFLTACIAGLFFQA